MDMTINTLQSQLAAVTPLTTDKIRQTPDVAVQTGAAASQKPAEKPADKEEMAKAVTQLNDYVQTVQRNLQFSLDQESGVMVVKVLEANTDKVIRQIPNEETLRLARNLVDQNDESALTLFRSKA